MTDQPKTILVVVTGMTPDEERLPGVRAVIEKPFTTANLHTVVDGTGG